MVDHPNEPDSNEPRTGDDFPADFFDDATDAPSAQAEPETHPSPTRPIDADHDAITDPAPASPTFEPAEPIPPSSAPSRSDSSPSSGPPVFPIVMGLALVGAVVSAIVFNMQGSKTTNATAPAPAPATAEAAPPTAPIEPEKPAPPEDVKALQTDLAHLTTQVKELQAKIDALPKPEPAPDLKPLQTQIAELAKSVESVSALPKKVSDLDDRITTFDKSLGTIKEEIAGLHDEVKKVGEQAAASKPATATAEATTALASSAALDEGAKLYKAGKFKEAAPLFLKLTESNPTDARVWYFAALSNGFATGQWTGKTAELVQKGIEREKAGTPSTAEIDAAFRDLTAANGKDWLAGYRKYAK